MSVCCARMGGVDESAVICRPALSFGFKAQRPPNSALCSERGAVLPTLETALLRYFAEAACVPEIE